VLGGSGGATGGTLGCGAVLRQSDVRGRRAPKTRESCAAGCVGGEQAWDSEARDGTVLGLGEKM
jgi:hypothetical protein